MMWTLFNPPCHDALKDAIFIPILPPDLKAKCTILLLKMASFIRDKAFDTIQEEVERLNEFTARAITHIYKFNKYPIKVTFNQTAVAQKAINSSLKMFNTRIPSHDIQQEDYTPVTNCLWCHAIEHIPPSNAPKEGSTEFAWSVLPQITYGTPALPKSKNVSTVKVLTGHLQRIIPDKKRQSWPRNKKRRTNEPPSPPPIATLPSP